MAANPQPASEGQLSKHEVVRLAGISLRSLRRYQHDRRIPPAPTDGLYQHDYVVLIQACKEKIKHELGEQAKKVLRTPEAIQAQKLAMARPETSAKLSDSGKLRWQTDQKGRERVAKWAHGIWAERRAREAQLDRLLAESKGPHEQTRQLKNLTLAEIVSNKLKNPDTRMWMSPDEVAEAFGINRATFFRNIGRYQRLKKGPKRWYLTSSVIDQLNTLRKK